ncbi:hypothetical protein CLH62_20400 [Marinobacter guineae]|uniref:Uncharacterized protein n=1 Tax=Marinobacter guineae TaxID=432303 RepID=A0A2G1VA57_9GAMM|nr:hypothetical protein [Marinobacter guineae]PHQ23643.1 hypothetical protein CLH62_20400 [Marinobacter guineae]
MRELIEFVVKVFSVYLIFRTLGTYIPHALTPEVFNASNSLHFGYFAASLSVPIVVGIVLWVKAPHISETAFPIKRSGTPAGECAMMATGLMLLGVDVAVRSVSVVLNQLGSGTPINYGWVCILFLSVAVVLGHKVIVEGLRKVCTESNGTRLT